MNRDLTLQLLAAHQPADAHETRMLEDIKQLITANNHILSLELEQKLDEKLRAQTEELRSIMDVSFDAVQEQLDDHETRIGTLENATV